MLLAAGKGGAPCWVEWDRKGRGRPIDPALQRRRNEASKARIANRLRKQGAARKQARSGGFVP